MFGIRYYKADSATYVIKSANGRVRRQGKGLSFYYNSATTSIAAVPVSVQEAPFIFNLQTSDFQAVRVQGQITFQVTDPEKTATMLNFNLKADSSGYVSEDPMKLSDRVVRRIQAMVQNKVQATPLRNALLLSQTLVDMLRKALPNEASLSAMGVQILDVTVSGIIPNPETARALEAEARESILQEADDAVYSRRKSAVEQERIIKDAELQTELSVQQKEQEIEESRLQNERAILRGKNETERERLQAEIESENQKKELVVLSVENKQMEADADAYAVAARMKAYRELPVENLKAMALANMNPEQLMAMAFDSLAQNAGKIGELNISPDMVGQLVKKVKQA